MCTDPDYEDPDSEGYNDAPPLPPQKFDSENAERKPEV
jgi:hypothetical protein